MAPEYPPKLAIWDLRYEDGKLYAALEYVELKTGVGRLGVHWAVEHEPPDCLGVGDGVAYVHRTESVLVRRVNDKATPEPLGNSRFRIQEGLPPDDPWLMMVLVLPPNCTLRDPRPEPVGAKEFKDRLALYWILKGDEFGRTRIDWTVQAADGNLQAEVEQINRGPGLGAGVPASGESVGDINISQSSVYIFRDQAQQYQQSGGVALHSAGDTTIGGDVSGRDKTGLSS